MKIPEKLKSRKFWITVATLVATLTGMPEETLIPLAGFISAYLLGQSYVDAKEVEKY